MGEMPQVCHHHRHRQHQVELLNANHPLDLLVDQLAGVLSLLLPRPRLQTRLTSAEFTLIDSRTFQTNLVLLAVDLRPLWLHLPVLAALMEPLAALLPLVGHHQDLEVIEAAVTSDSQV